MLLLTNLIGFSAVYASWQVEERAKEFFALLLLLITGVMGTFVATDLFIFFLFYEVVVIPIYLLIIMFGSSKRVTREYAGMKLTIYLLIGSAFLLVGLISLFIKAQAILGFPTMDISTLAAVDFPVWFQVFVFALMALGFGTLLSMFPFHAWSPDGYAGAPTAVKHDTCRGVKEDRGLWADPHRSLYTAPGRQIYCAVNSGAGHRQRGLCGFYMRESKRI